MPVLRSDLERYMHAALREAELGRDAKELGIGAVLVVAGEIVAAGHSRQIEHHTPLAHAELDVLWRGSERLADGADEAMLVTTVEPCLMCVGAALRLGVNRIAFGMDNPNAGRRLLDDGVPIQLYQGGILEARAREVMESG